MTVNKMQYAHPEYLVETNWLESNLNDPQLRIFDCSVNVVPNPDETQSMKIPFVYQSGRANYEKAHIPNAGFIDIPGELSDKTSAIPLMLPSEQQFVEAIRRYGISQGNRVVLYSTTEPNWAARVWWMLNAFGFKNVAIVNGGWVKWCAEQRPVSNATCAYESGNFTANLQTEFFMDKQNVLNAISQNETRIINSLPTPMHTGESDIVFGRKGRIANSVNVPFNSLHDPDSGCYLPAEQLQEKFEAVKVRDAKQFITYCGGGIAASNNAFVLSLLGYKNVAVYDGSMLEWGNDASLPMEEG